MLRTDRQIEALGFEHAVKVMADELEVRSLRFDDPAEIVRDLTIELAVRAILFYDDGWHTFDGSELRELLGPVYDAGPPVIGALYS